LAQAKFDISDVSLGRGLEDQVHSKSLLTYLTKSLKVDSNIPPVLIIITVVTKACLLLKYKLSGKFVYFCNLQHNYIPLLCHLYFHTFVYVNAGFLRRRYKLVVLCCFTCSSQFYQLFAFILVVCFVNFVVIHL